MLKNDGNKTTEQTLQVWRRMVSCHLEVSQKFDYSVSGFGGITVADQTDKQRIEAIVYCSSIRNL